MKSGDRLDSLLDIISHFSGKERSELLSFTADLSSTDLTNFILAADDNLTGAHGLAEAAGSGTHLGDFIDAVENMISDDKDNFLEAATHEPGGKPGDIVGKTKEGGYTLFGTDPLGFNAFLRSAVFMGSKMGPWVKTFI